MLATKLLRRPTLSWLLCTFFVALTWTATRAGEKEGAPRKPELWTVISQLRKEAVEAWREGARWPRSQPDFSAEKNWKMEEADVVRGLSQKLHKEPAIDAYIKWQLLSFVDGFRGMDQGKLNAVAQRAPRYLPQPVIREEWLAVSGPSGAFIAITQQTAYVQNVTPVVGNGAVGLNPQIGFATSGAVMGVEGSTISYITVIRAANARLSDERFAVAHSNEMIERYRDALAQRLPEQGGARLAWMIRDAAERVEAGEPSTGDAVVGLLDATANLPHGLPADRRSEFAAQVKQLGELETTVHDAVRQGARENDAWIDTHTVAVEQEDIDTMVARLEAPAE